MTIDLRMVKALTAQNTVFHELHEVFGNIFKEKFGGDTKLLWSTGGWDYRGFLIRIPGAEGYIPEEYQFYVRSYFHRPTLIRFEDRRDDGQILGTLDLETEFILTLDGRHRFDKYIEFAQAMVRLAKP